MNSLNWFRKTSSDPHEDIKFGPSLLYLDDVQSIYDMLVTFAECSTSGNSPETGASLRRISESYDSVIILADDTEVDAIEDLKEITHGKLSHLSLVLLHPYVQISLWRNGAGIAFDSDNSKSRGFASSIKDYINSRRQFWVRFGFERFRVFIRSVLTRPLSVILVVILVLSQLAILGFVVYIATSSSAAWPAKILIPFIFLLQSPFFAFFGGNTVRVVPAWRHNSARAAGRSRVNVWWTVAAIFILAALLLKILSKNQVKE